MPITFALVDNISLKHTIGGQVTKSYNKKVENNYILANLVYAIARYIVHFIQEINLINESHI